MLFLFFLVALIASAESEGSKVDVNDRIMIHEDLIKQIANAGKDLGKEFKVYSTNLQKDRLARWEALKLKMAQLESKDRDLEMWLRRESAFRKDVEAAIASLATGVERLNRTQQQAEERLNQTQNAVSEELTTNCEFFKLKIQVYEQLHKEDDDIKKEQLSNLMTEVDALKRLVHNLTEEVVLLKLEQTRKERQKSLFDVFTLSNGKQYHITYEEASWYEAKRFCEKNGMRLASPKTQAEITLLQQKLQQLHKGGAFWLSASDVGRKGAEIRWLDGQVLPVNSPLWFKGDSRFRNEPSDFGKGNEVCVYMRATADKLYDYRCFESPGPFICEVL